MTGAIIFVVILVVVIPVSVLMSGAVLSAILGGLLKTDRDIANRNDDGEPNEHLVLAQANPWAEGVPVEDA